MPLQQYDSSGSGGPTQGGSGSHESRTFTYESQTFAVVNGFTDVTHSYSGDSDPEYYENLYLFYGNVQVLDDRSIILLPASMNSPYETREISIRHDGYILADRYLQGDSAGMEYFYSYNADNVAISEMIRQWSVSTSLSYQKTEFIYDSEGRRLQENVYVSSDSLDWQEAITRQYSYTGEAFDNGKDYEKYSYYRPRDHALYCIRNGSFPYICNHWYLASMSETIAGEGTVISEYDYGFFGEAWVAGYFYNWDSIGLPLNYNSEWDVFYNIVGYTWNRMYVGNSKEIQSPTPNKLRAYPNPFNPSTTIEFELKSNSSPVIKVYNVRGQICRKYEPGKLITGTHTWYFDGKDMRGNALPIGVYLVRMEIPGQNIVKRISLSK